MDETIREIEKKIKRGVQTQRIVSNSSKINLMKKKELKEIIKDCPLINADGASIAWTVKILGIP